MLFHLMAENESICQFSFSKYNCLGPTRERSLQVGSEPMENGIMTSVTQGAMSGILPHLL